LANDDEPHGEQDQLCCSINRMNGQWTGRYSGSTSGLLLIDLDDMDTHYEGRMFAYDDNPSLPTASALLKHLTRAAPSN
jgi:hypothetical protein